MWSFVTSDWLKRTLHRRDRARMNTWPRVPSVDANMLRENCRATGCTGSPAAAGREVAPAAAGLLVAAGPRQRAARLQEVAQPVGAVVVVVAERPVAAVPQGPWPPPAAAVWAATRADSRNRRGRRT